MNELIALLTLVITYEIGRVTVSNGIIVLLRTKAQRHYFIKKYNKKMTITVLAIAGAVEIVTYNLLEKL